MINEETTKEPATSGELLGQLAHELSLLVRSELELAAAQQGPQLRRVATELVAALAAGAALLLALAAASLAAIQGLTLAMPAWGASLIVAAAWAAVAGLLLRLDHPRRLQQRLAEDTRHDAIASAERRRNEAEEAVKGTVERLGRAVAREGAQSELDAGVSATERMAGAAEQGAEDLVKEVIDTLLASGKAGISLVERIVSRQPPPDR